MDIEDSFLLQLARAIQSWLSIEAELFLLYSMFMEGANGHLVSATFNTVQSVDVKLSLLNSCFVLVFERNSDELRSWKTLRKKLAKLNMKRNKLVHEPVSTLYSKGTRTVLLHPSFLNALALVKGQTTHQGKPIVSAEYNPSEAKIREDHKLSESGVAALERTFKATAAEMRVYRKSITPKVTAAMRRQVKEAAVTMPPNK